MNKLKRFFKVAAVLFQKRVLWVMAFAVLFGAIGYQVDRYKFDHAPAEQFVDYYSFNVSNSRAGEPVNFTVCRRHDELYTYTGSLSIYIVPDTNNTSQNVQVYQQQLAGQLRPGDCENKVVKSSQYSHQPGNYTMSFCISFKVKYDFAKHACKSSNIYTVFPQPADIQSQIDYFQNQIRTLQKQIDDSSQTNSATDFYAGPTPTPAITNNQASNPSSPGQATQSPVAVQATPQPPTAVKSCSLSLLGICILE